MNDTVATEDQEQPVKTHELTARSHDRDSRSSDFIKASGHMLRIKQAGHMAAADQIVSNGKKVLARGGRPHMGLGNKSPAEYLLLAGSSPQAQSKIAAEN